MFGFFKKKDKKAPGVSCSKCGGENPTDARFCLNCGADMTAQKKVQGTVAEATQITEDFKDKGGFWAKIIPGYHGYKKKEIRREADKLLRDYLVKQLANAKGVLGEIQEEAASDAPGVLSKLEDMLTELDTFSRKIQHADYGFGSMFGSDKVKENELDKLIDFDRQVVGVVIELANALKAFASDISDAEDKTKEVRRMIKDATRFYAQRDQFIQGWTPTD